LQVRTISYSLYVPDKMAYRILKNSLEWTAGGFAQYEQAFKDQMERSGVPVTSVQKEGLIHFVTEMELEDIAVRVCGGTYPLAIALLPFWVQ